MTIGPRIKQLRLARGMSLDTLAAELGGVVTKQALSKYELGKSQPSARVLTRLAAALGVKTSQLATPPAVEVAFIGYRRRASLPPREQEQIESAVAYALEQRVWLQRCLQATATIDLPIMSLAVRTLDEADDAALHVRSQWGLGSEPIANVTATLEDHLVHVIEIDGGDRFDGISAIARDSEQHAISAAVVSDTHIDGERQRLNLTHELGHLVLDVSQVAHEELIEPLAFRFGAALLAPASLLRQEVGARRSFLSLEELLLLKQRFGMSIQALLHRLRDLGIISEAAYVQWCKDISRLGWRKAEPGALAREQPTWFRRHVLRAAAEELISDDEATRMLPDLTEKASGLRLIQRRAFLSLSLEQRRTLLAEQAASLAPTYTIDSDWQGLNADDIIDEA